MRDGDLILAIDNGTQSLKAMIFDLTGRLMAAERRTFTPYQSPRPGWAEQDPDLFYRALAESCTALLSRGDVNRARIAGVALTAQRCTMVNVDELGTPLRPAIIWPDTRKSEKHRPVGGLWGALFKLTGLDATVARLLADAEANWIATNEPAIWDKTHKFLFLSGYLTYRLTDQFVDSVGCQVGYVPFDYKRLTWARSWDWKSIGIPIPREKLPTLCPQGSILGRVTARAARETGIPEGLPLVAAATDKACEALGAGGVDPGIACLSLGTQATVTVIHPRYIEPIFLLPAYPAALPRHHALEMQIYRGYSMVRWFLDELGQAECVSAAGRHIPPEDLLDGIASSTPPGAMGLLLQPYWTPGILVPGPEAKGAIIGFGEIHTRAHVYRSILEGLAYGLRHGLEQIEKKTKVSIRRLKVSGGGAGSDQAMQITADIFGLPAERGQMRETSGLGAAICAACGLGLHSDYQSAVAAMIGTEETFVPNEENRRLYERVYREVYLKMYKQLKPLYKSIREITRYPSW